MLGSEKKILAEVARDERPTPEDCADEAFARFCDCIVALKRSVEKLGQVCIERHQTHTRTSR